jgi:hypothetical protein
MNNENYMTVNQVHAACNKHNYLLFRFASGYQMGINGKVAMLARKHKEVKDTDKTIFISYLPCSLNEYIQHKHSFIL